jgi:hypothetical protein
VLELSPVRSAETETAVDPEPTFCEAVAVDVARVLLVPHSNQPEVDRPFGLMLPEIVAELAVMLVAVLDETVGAVPPPADVEKIAPLLPMTAAAPALAHQAA